MSLVSSLLQSARAMDHEIANFKFPENHDNHRAELDFRGYVGSGEHEFSYECGCGESFYLGSADPDLVDDKTFELYSKIQNK